MEKLIRVTSFMTYDQWIKFGRVRVSTYTPKSDVLGLLMALPEEELKELIQRCHELDPAAGKRETEDVELGSRLSPTGNIVWPSVIPALRKLLHTLGQQSTEPGTYTIGFRLQEIWELLELGTYSPKKAAPMVQVLLDLRWEMCRVPKYRGASSTVRVWAPCDRNSKVRAATEAEIAHTQRALAADLDLLTQSTK